MARLWLMSSRLERIPAGAGVSGVVGLSQGCWGARWHHWSVCSLQPSSSTATVSVMVGPQGAPLVMISQRTMDCVDSATAMVSLTVGRALRCSVSAAPGWVVRVVRGPGRGLL